MLRAGLKFEAIPKYQRPTPASTAPRHRLRGRGYQRQPLAPLGLTSVVSCQCSPNYPSPTALYRAHTSALLCYRSLRWLRIKSNRRLPLGQSFLIVVVRAASRLVHCALFRFLGRFKRIFSQVQCGRGDHRFFPKRYAMMMRLSHTRARARTCTHTHTHTHTCQPGGNRLASLAPSSASSPKGSSNPEASSASTCFTVQAHRA